jgi:hypothetical protein
MKNLAKLFKGKDDYSEEMKEARAIKAGKITPMEYAKGEKMEEAKKTKKMSEGGMVARGGGAAIRGIKFVKNG